MDLLGSHKGQLSSLVTAGLLLSSFQISAQEGGSQPQLSDHKGKVAQKEAVPPRLPRQAKAIFMLLSSVGAALGISDSLDDIEEQERARKAFLEEKALLEQQKQSGKPAPSGDKKVSRHFTTSRVLGTGKPLPPAIIPAPKKSPAPKEP